MTDDLQVHPADVLAQQLDRVTGLVRTLGELYSPDHENFATGSNFIAHGLVAVTTLLADAQGALDHLNQVCDLQIRTQPTTVETHSASSDPVVVENEPMVFPPTEPEWHQQDDAARPMVADAAAQVQQAQRVDDDEFAQSYLELLRKLTAAEVFAAEQQALAPPGSSQNLLPLLRSLREEFQKLHRVA